MRKTSIEKKKFGGPVISPPRAADPCVIVLSGGLPETEQQRTIVRNVRVCIDAVSRDIRVVVVDQQLVSRVCDYSIASGIASISENRRKQQHISNTIRGSLNRNRGVKNGCM